jgi:hypothetical protein
MLQTEYNWPSLRIGAYRSPADKVRRLVRYRVDLLRGTELPPGFLSMTGGRARWQCPKQVAGGREAPTTQQLRFTVARGLPYRAYVTPHPGHDKMPMIPFKHSIECREQLAP